MAEQLPQEQTISIEELVLSHSYEMLALITVLEKKGILTREEIIEVIKELRDSK
jgi:transketolase N-terminal domain/subunit